MLTISVVLYKTPASQIEAYLVSLSHIKIPYKLYVIDNSPDSELHHLFSAVECEYTHLPQNPGYGAGHNVAIRRAIDAGSAYHIVMNTDLSFKNDVASPMVKYMEDHPRVGHLMPRILNPDGSIQRLCKLVPTPFDLFARMFFPSAIKAKLSQRFELHGSGYDKIMFVPYLSGCFMVLRTEALKEVGLFDERFFMYPEDIDLTRRIAVRYETIFFPECTVVHEHTASSKKSLRMLWVHVFNIVKYFNKWGWIFDRSRRTLNQKTLSQYSEI